jgi:hypothetical protein
MNCRRRSRQNSHLFSCTQGAVHTCTNAACRATAICGRQVFISTIERAVPFDIFAFYRGRHHFIGIDSLALDSAAGAPVLDALRPTFEVGTLRLFPVLPENIYPLPTPPRPAKSC